MPLFSKPLVLDVRRWVRSRKIRRQLIADLMFISERSILSFSPSKTLYLME